MTALAGQMPAGLYLITPDTADTVDLVRRVEAALRGTPALLQYRNKCLTGDARIEQAAEIRLCCHAAGVGFIVNDDVDLALQLDADGVHLGRDDGHLGLARERLGNGRLLGVSCYNEWTRAEAAAQAGADYVAFGAMFASSTKPGAVAASPELLTRARAELAVGVVAIGGITLERAPSIIAAGATQLAVISDVFEAPDPAARARDYGRLFAPDSTHPA